MSFYNLQVDPSAFGRRIYSSRMPSRNSVHPSANHPSANHPSANHPSSNHPSANHPSANQNLGQSTARPTIPENRPHAANQSPHISFQPIRAHMRVTNNRRDAAPIRIGHESNETKNVPSRSQPDWCNLAIA